MLEHVTRAMYYTGVHLLFASMVWVAAWILTAIPLGSASTKYWIWWATSLNFMLPLAAVVDRIAGPHISWASPLTIVGAAAGIFLNAATAAAAAALWLIGAAVMAARLFLRIRAERRAAADRRMPSFLAHGVPVAIGGNWPVPAVSGILRPYISLPAGIDRLLTERELDAVLIHEVQHATRRDNLMRLIYEIALCGLWFHPLVWLTGERLSLCRELSCDEAVVSRGRGQDLIAALAKLTHPEASPLLEASASSFVSVRLAGLAANRRLRPYRAAGAMLAVAFAAVVLGGVLETVAHTACCFRPSTNVRRSE